MFLFWGVFMCLLLASLHVFKHENSYYLCVGGRQVRQCLLLRLTIWAGSLQSTWQKGRTHSCMFPSRFHDPAMARACTLTHWHHSYPLYTIKANQKSLLNGNSSLLRTTHKDVLSPCPLPLLQPFSSPPGKAATDFFRCFQWKLFCYYVSVTVVP